MTITTGKYATKDGASASKDLKAQLDSSDTTVIPVHSVTDGAGTIISPATSGKQDTGNTSLATIATAVQAALPAGTNTIGAVAAGVNVITGNTTTRPADTTAYAYGDLVANSVTAGSVVAATIAAARGTDIATAAVRCRLQTSSTVLTSAIFRVHFFNAAPTVTNGDNGAFLPAIANWVGAFDVTIGLAGSDGAIGVGLPTYGPAMIFKPASGTSNLYYLIEARAAYTPTSGEVFTPYLEIQ